MTEYRIEKRSVLYTFNRVDGAGIFITVLNNEKGYYYKNEYVELYVIQELNAQKKQSIILDII